MADLTIWAYAHGGRFRPDPPAFHVIHSTEGPMSRGNAKALAQWFARSPASGGPGTSATDIFDPVDDVTMLDEHTIPYHVGPVGNGLSTGSEHCGSVKLTQAQWLSDDGQAMLDRSAKRQAQRAIDRGWSLADCRWLSLTEVARRTVKGFCTHNDVRLALGGTTHSDPGKNFPYAWFMDRIRYWFQVLTGAINPEDDDVAKQDVIDALREVFHLPDTGLAVPRGQRHNGQLAVNLTSMGQQGFNADSYIKAAVDAVKADTDLTGDDEANILAKLAEIEATVAALKPAPEPTPEA